MKTRMMIAGILISAAATSAQPTATVDLNWRNTQTGGQHPIGPGQTADIWLDVSFTPSVGTALQGGEVAGLASLFFDLLGSGDTSGSWTLSGPGFVSNAWQHGCPWCPPQANYGRRTDIFGGWALGGVGSALPNGTIVSAQAGQFPLSPPASAFNPVVEIWRGKWQPGDYSDRIVDFTSQKAEISLQTGIAIYILEPGDIHRAIHVQPANITWGSVQVPVIPAPSGMLVVVGGAMVALGRRRA